MAILKKRKEKKKLRDKINEKLNLKWILSSFCLSTKHWHTTSLHVLKAYILGPFNFSLLIFLIRQIGLQILSWARKAQLQLPHAVGWLFRTRLDRKVQGLWFVYKVWLICHTNSLTFIYLKYFNNCNLKYTSKQHV